MSNQEFVAKGGTRFSVYNDAANIERVLVDLWSNETGVSTVALADVLEFIHSVEPPLSRRTEVLGMMAATIWRDARGEWKPDEIAAEAKVLLAAVEEAEAK